MLRFALCLLLGLTAVSAHAENIVPLQIGGAEINVGVEDQLLQLSTQEPFLFEKTSAALPPVMHFIDGFVSPDDMKRAVAGESMVGPFYQVHVMRPLEPLTFSDSEWAKFLPMIKKGLLTTSVSKAEEAELNKRASAAYGTKMSFDATTLTPTVYSEENGVLRFTMVVPTKIETSPGKAVQITLDCGGAIVRLHGKAVYLLVYALHHEGKDATAVIPALDIFVNRAIELNDPASTPAVKAVASSTRGF